jgi:hypothetical protein
MNASKFLEQETVHTEKVRALVNWSMNYDIKKGTPYQIFLDLIGYSVEHFGEAIVQDVTKVSIGYKELGFLGEALTEYSDSPKDVMDWIEKLDDLEGSQNDN